MNSHRIATYIRAIERAQSISGAAETLGISQPALSAQLKKAESSLNAKLFDRSRTPLTLTEEGRVYLDYLDEVEMLELDMKRRISDLEHLQTGRIAVGGATSFNISRLVSAVTEFSAAFPNIEIEVVDGTVEGLSSAAQNGSLDLFIAPRLNNSDAFVQNELVDERAFLCIPNDWAVVSELPEPNLHGYASISHEDIVKLSGLPFIALHENQRVGQMLARLIERHGITPSKTIHAEQTLTSLALTQAGAGVSLVTESTLGPGIFQCTPALYLADEDICTRKLYVSFPKNRYASHAALAFTEILQRTVSSAYES